MLKHAPLGDASPVEVREAQCVSGPLAVLDDYYGVYVTCPDDAQYRLDWIKEIYTPDMNNDYVYPNVFMSSEDTEQVSNLQADLQTYMNTQKADWIMNGTTDAEWNEYLSKLEDYRPVRLSGHYAEISGCLLRIRILSFGGFHERFDFTKSPCLRGRARCCHFPGGTPCLPHDSLCGWLNDPNGFSFYQASTPVLLSITPTMCGGRPCTGVTPSAPTCCTGSICLCACTGFPGGQRPRLLLRLCHRDG